MNEILRIKNIYKSYGTREVLHDVGFELKKGEVLGIAGESGSGKSTCARIITGLTAGDSGEIWLAGSSAYAEEGHSGTSDTGKAGSYVRSYVTAERVSWQQLNMKRDRKTRRRMQMVFQNPESSLNPRYKIGRILYDAMAYHMESLGRLNRDAGKEGFPIGNGKSLKESIWTRCSELINRLELPPDTLNRYPGSFSGGQKQRIALARALSIEPDILIADEPTSSLDVSVQYRMLELIKEIQKESNLSVIFISHDLGVINYICDRVIIMKDGRIEECADTDDFFRHPKTSYGRELIDSVPVYKAGGGSKI